MLTFEHAGKKYRLSTDVAKTAMAAKLPGDETLYQIVFKSLAPLEITGLTPLETNQEIPADRLAVPEEIQ